MPKFNPTEDDKLPVPNSGYHYSAVKPALLGATEYTLVTLVRDRSGSVSSYANDLDACTKVVIEACRKSPRAENLLIRVTDFNGQVDEVHGFKLLDQIDTADYQPIYCGGGTALFDAVHNAIGASNAYGASLSSKKFTVNSCVYIITDGDDNQSVLSPTAIKAEIDKARTGETMESIVTVLVGVNTSQGFNQYLQDFQAQAGLDQYVNLGDATPGKLAKLAGFISKSISSSSQSLGSGAPAPVPTVTF